MNPVVHFEMPYENGDRVSKFYSQVFGWQMNMMDGDMGNYLLAGTTETDENRMVKTPGTINGGFFEKKPDWPAGTSVVISVKDINAAIKSINAAEGKVLGDPMDIPGVGKYVSFMDTEGNRVSILQPMGM